MLANLYAMCPSTGMECLFFPLEDTEFFKRYCDGIPIYDEYKRIVNKYAMVFLDGPHTTELDQLDDYIRANGFAVLEQGGVQNQLRQVKP